MIACHPNNEIEIFCLYLFNNDGGLAQNWGMEEIQLVINTKHKVVCLMHSEARQYLNVVVWRAEKGLLQNCTEDGWLVPPKIPNSPEGFSKALPKARWGKDVVSCCRLLGVGILCSCSCPHRSGHDVPINLQQDKYYSLFWNFLYEWTLKGWNLENGLSCIFQTICNILLQ